jgi:7-cyano-7-deazaguanine reductase
MSVRRKVKAKRKCTLQLGRKVPIPTAPDEAVLDSVANPHCDADYVVRFTAPEFTSLCPITGQPDFAHFVIDYCPGAKLLESKSFKLYLMSFRNHAAFHEECTLTIGKNIVQTIKPKFFRIAGFWYPRGGIPIDIFWQTGKLPKGVWLSDPGVLPYRGRG